MYTSSTGAAKFVCPAALWKEAISSCVSLVWLGAPSKAQPTSGQKNLAKAAELLAAREEHIGSACENVRHPV